MAKRPKRTGPTASVLRQALGELMERAEISAAVVAARVQHKDNQWDTYVMADGDDALYPQMLDDVAERLMPDEPETADTPKEGDEE